MLKRDFVEIGSGWFNRRLLEAITVEENSEGKWVVRIYTKSHIIDYQTFDEEYRAEILVRDLKYNLNWED